MNREGALIYLKKGFSITNTRFKDSDYIYMKDDHLFNSKHYDYDDYFYNVCKYDEGWIIYAYPEGVLHKDIITKYSNNLYQLHIKESEYVYTVYYIDMDTLEIDGSRKVDNTNSKISVDEIFMMDTKLVGYKYLEFDIDSLNRLINHRILISKFKEKEKLERKETKMKNPNIHIYHHGDKDGKGSAAIIYKYYRDKGISDYSTKISFYNMYDYSIEMNITKVKPGDIVYIVDYSPSSEINQNHIKDLFDNGEVLVIWIDHHASSIKDEKSWVGERNIQGIRDVSISGTALTWMWLYNRQYINFIKFKNLDVEMDAKLTPSQDFIDTFYDDDTIPDIVKIIESHDTFRDRFPHTKEYHLGIPDIDPTESKWELLLEPGNDIELYTKYMETWLYNGKVIKNYLDTQNKVVHMDRYSFEITMDGHKIICLNRECDSTTFGDKYFEYDAVLKFYFDGKVYHYSMYCQPDSKINLLEIGKKYNFKGHEHACGVMSDKLFIYKDAKL